MLEQHCGTEYIMAICQHMCIDMNRAVQNVDKFDEFLVYKLNWTQS